jgi:hypothetical protein
VTNLEIEYVLQPIIEYIGVLTEESEMKDRGKKGSEDGRKEDRGKRGKGGKDGRKEERKEGKKEGRTVVLDTPST